MPQVTVPSKRKQFADFIALTIAGVHLPICILLLKCPHTESWEISQ